MLLLPYAKDVAQRQQSFAAAVVELTGQVKVKFQQKLLPCPPPMPPLAHPLYSLSLPALYNLQRQKTNKCFSMDLNPFRNRRFQVATAPLVHHHLRSAGRVASSFAPWQICYANGQRFNYRARQLKYRHMKHKLKRI